ncbi:hypothetical protein [Leptospira sp. GIMC2001]|uniref:hypothetical protein n=1 Tax=Leptospira sp. GIMC2001 TaxID=1513297 RepID=UPI00234A1C6D|nr:hypothetical protein [Leptospira sp. GIMC2001]WCL48036.1 hypothetical protein O4O04_11980 [Leptospira sp. GIMC2001]
MWEINNFGDSPISDWAMVGAHQIVLNRDDQSPFGFGTKIRKWKGIENRLRNQTDPSRNVLLCGSLHGNYLASFSYLFRKASYNVTSIGLSYNPNFQSANSIITKHSSNNIVIANRSNLKETTQNILKANPTLIEIPQYGFCDSAMLGLNSLWIEIENHFRDKISNMSRNKEFPNQIQLEENKFSFIVYLDIGSGLSFLSALNYFHKKPIILVKGMEIAVQVIGICLGESKKSWLEKYEYHLKMLNLSDSDLPNQSLMEKNIWEADDLPGFGKSNAKINQWITTKYKETDILLDPIYSAKSLIAIENVLQSSKINWQSSYGIYVHQGGFLNFLDLALK